MPKDADPVDASVGQRIRAYRLSRGLSQSALGEMVGVTSQQVQKYERGVNRIGVSRLQRIATALNVPVSAFFGESERSGDAAGDGVLTEALARPYAMRMLWAFNAIEDDDMRRALVQFVESIGPGTG